MYTYKFKASDFGEVIIPEATRDRLVNNDLVWRYSPKQAKAWANASPRIRSIVKRRFNGELLQLAMTHRPTLKGTNLQVHYGYRPEHSQGCALVADAHNQRSTISWSDGCVVTNAALLSLTIKQQAGGSGNE